MSASSTVVLITGANSGIGYATAKILALASPEYQILLCSRSASNGEKACAEINQLPGVKGTLIPLQLDVNDEDSIAKAVEYVTSKFARLDAFINNAAVGSRDPSFKKQLQETLETNVVGATIVSEAFIPLLLKSNKPYLLHISSGLGSFGLSTDPKAFSSTMDAYAYRLSKAALNMLAVQHHRVLGPKGVKVFATNPGFIESNLRGKSEEARTGGGLAAPAETAGEFLLDVIRGKRDKDVGKFIHRDGAYFKSIKDKLGGMDMTEAHCTDANGDDGVYPW